MTPTQASALERQVRDGYARSCAILHDAGMHVMAEWLHQHLCWSAVPPWEAADELRAHARSRMPRERQRALVTAALELDRLSGAYARQYGVLPDRWITPRDQWEASVFSAIRPEYAEPAGYYAGRPEALDAIA
jgi:hypothetical protein